MALESGRRLGPYEIVSPLGAGGMGEVYRARDTRLERTVAIKVLPSHLSESPEVRQRFDREARSLSSLSHPHICALFDVGHEDGIDFLVMEYLEGENLAERLKRGPLPIDEVLRQAMQIADALDRAHRQGIVHRDLKPGNVMLTASGVKLLDFGLAKATAVPDASGGTQLPTMSHDLTKEGTILGTFHYMAPEQLEGKEADARSDIFAFGAVLYEMATGRKAFGGTSQATLIASIIGAEPPPISAVQPLTPPALERVVRICLAKNPEERWQSAHDIKSQLQWIAEEGSQAGIPAPRAARRKRREGLAWGLAAVLAAALAVTGFLGWRLAGRLESATLPLRASINAPQGSLFIFTGDLAGPIVLSPDGRHAAFVATAPDGTRPIWVRSLESGRAEVLAGTDGATFPFWSADSRSIGFFADAKLKRVDAEGGLPLTVCAAANGRGGTWNRDDVIVFSPEFRGGLSRVLATGGEPVPLTEVDEARHTTHRWPFFLPDGNHFVFLATNHSSTMAEHEGIFLGSLDGAEPTRLIRASSNAAYASGHLIFTREATLMAQPLDIGSGQMAGRPVALTDSVQVDPTTWYAVYSVSQEGTVVYQAGEAAAGTRLVWFDRNGRELGTVGPRDFYGSLDLSPDGQRVAVELSTANEDIWIHDLARDVRSRLTFTPNSDIFPVWSPDGTWVAFASDRDGQFGVFRKAASGTGAVESLVQRDVITIPGAWSPDGKQLAFMEDFPTIALNALTLDGGEPTEIVRTGFIISNPDFSPDGRWLAYFSLESGRSEVYVIPYPSGDGKWQISSGGGNYPRWRRDGRELFFLAPDGNVMAAEVDGRGETFGIGQVTSLFRANPKPSISAYDVSADGQRFLVNTMEQQSEPVTLLLHWPRLLP